MEDVDGSVGCATGTSLRGLSFLHLRNARRKSCEQPQYLRHALIRHRTKHKPGILPKPEKDHKDATEAAGKKAPHKKLAKPDQQSGGGGGRASKPKHTNKSNLDAWV